MRTRDIDTNDTGLPIPGHEHDPPRSQALEEGGRVLTERAIQRMQEKDWGEIRPNTRVEAKAQKLPCETSAIQDDAVGAGKLAAPVDLLERLLPVYLEAARVPFTDETKELPGPRTRLRAVLAELAAMGGAALPSVGLIERAWYSHDGPLGNQCAATAEGVRSMLMRSVAPILAAKDAERERLRERCVGLENAVLRLNGWCASIHVECDARTKERDAARAKVAELEAEAWILRIAPRAAMYASRVTGAEEDAQLAADVIRAGADIAADLSPWANAVLEYAAKARGT